MDFLNKTEANLDLAATEKEQIMRELKSHYLDLLDELTVSGMEPALAEQEAARRLGNPKDIASRLNAAHNSASWKSALLCAVPFAASAIFFIASFIKKDTIIPLILIMITAIIMATGTLREIIKGRRPIWLSTWMASALIIQIQIIHKYFNYRLSPYFHKTCIVEAILFAIIVLILACRTTTWKRFSIITSSLTIIVSAYLLCSCSNNIINVFLLLVVSLLFVVLVILFSRYVFETHIYGNGAKATLFLLSLFVLNYENKPELVDVLASVIGIVIIAEIVIWFARLIRNQDKRSSVRWALYFSVLTNMENAHPSWISLIFLVTVGAFLTMIIFSIPILIPINSQINSHYSRRHFSQYFGGFGNE